MQLEKIKNICNLGTGTMGYGTALTFALAGYQVRMFGRSDASIERGFTSIRSALDTYCNNNLLDKSSVPAVLARIKGVTTLEEAAVDADFLIESIAEDMEIKRGVYAKMETLCRPDTIFATNTSTLCPTDIAEALQHKDRFVVAHFWNPAHLIPLVEVVPGKETSSATVDTTWKLIEKIGKKPVALKREALGFIGNRLQLALLREALYIVEAGIATPEAVDAAVKFGMGRRLGVTGPLESVDLGGLDIFYNIARYLGHDLCSDCEIPPFLKQAMEKGTLGAKTKQGVYEWTDDRLNGIKKQRETVLIEWLQRDKANA